MGQGPAELGEMLCLVAKVVHSKSAAQTLFMMELCRALMANGPGRCSGDLACAMLCRLAEAGVKDYAVWHAVLSFQVLSARLSLLLI